MELASTQIIESRIFTFQGKQVMVDRDLAELYQVQTKVLNQAVKRNSNRFPKAFSFQLTDEELKQLVTNCDRFKNLKHTSSNPYVFTEQGVAMLSAVLRSDVAVDVSIQIMNTFVIMRRHIGSNKLLLQRLDNVEHQQLEANQKFEKIFKALESKNPMPEKGVFFDGQIFDAYTFIADLIRKAKTSIILIDNYVDDSVLTILNKRNEKVRCTICTKTIFNMDTETITILKNLKVLGYE